jgi:hypothetical protein
MTVINGGIVQKNNYLTITNNFNTTHDPKINQFTKPQNKPKPKQP